jgi:ankyrin repeat protein
MGQVMCFPCGYPAFFEQHPSEVANPASGKNSKAWAAAREKLSPEQNAELDLQLFDAAEKGDMDKVLSLIDQGGDPDWHNPDSNERTALIQACQYGHTSTARALVKAGANVEVKSIAGATPLICASRDDGHLATVKYLIEECGANVEAECTGGKTSLFFSKRDGNSDVEQYLRSKLAY